VYVEVEAEVEAGEAKRDALVSLLLAAQMRAGGEPIMLILSLRRSQRRSWSETPAAQAHWCSL
jgi:hypothetical protein